jgi:hypothetical protein
MEQPLHSVTVKEYVQIVKDVRATRMSLISPKRWHIENAGFCRTFRLPKSLGVPHLAKCEGVLGHVIDRDEIYVHTDGRNSVVIDLSPAGKAEQLPYLVSSSGHIEFASLTSGRIEGKVTDLRENTVVLGGLHPGAKNDLTVTTDAPLKSVATVDKGGLLRLQLPSVCTFQLAIPHK